MLIQPYYAPSCREEMLDFITNEPNTILEIGCREGLFTKEVKKIYSIKDSWGIEPDAHIKEIAKENIDNLIIDFFNTDTKLPTKYFDLIVFNDVLEHMYDPWEAMIKAKTLLSKDGIIIISIPNIRHKSIIKNLLWNDDFTYEKNGILDITHIRFFTRSTIMKIFTELKFEIIKVSPIKLKKRKRWYKVITSLPRNLFNLITLNKFESMQHHQYGFTIK
jgi:2-polyprenyl-3-methyl-5-hydroxy-6-metoxy-1,4-benzoquinol methylase